jgi:hypothetical protein
MVIPTNARHSGKSSRSLSVCARSVVVPGVGRIRRAYEAAKADGRATPSPTLSVFGKAQVPGCAESVLRRLSHKMCGCRFWVKRLNLLYYGRAKLVVGQMSRKLGLAKRDWADD